MKYGQDDFVEMIRNWQTDNSPEYDDLEIDAPEIDDDTEEWVAYASDKEALYSLTDNGRGNIVINYLSSK